MIAVDDSWHIRFPDGHITRAANTTVVRQNLRQGHISPICMVRRSDKEEWQPLERTREFADLVGDSGFLEEPGPLDRSRRNYSHTQPEGKPRSNGITSRLKLKKLRTASVGLILKEMVLALESALTRRKIIAAALLTGTLALLMATVRVVPLFARGVVDYAATAAVAAALVTAAACFGLLAKLTNVELQYLRPARWKEGRAGLFGLTLRLTLTMAAAYVGALAIPVGLVWASRWLVALSDPFCTVLASMAAILAVGAAVCLVPLALSALLLGTILVFEECSSFAALRKWMALMWKNPRRIVLFETATVAVSALLAVPFLLTVVATNLVPLDKQLSVVGDCARTFLTGLALAPSAAFLAVANVFLFVRLRYQGASD